MAWIRRCQIRRSLACSRTRPAVHRQISELATHYGKLEILWLDGGGNEWLGFGGVKFDGRWHARAQDQPYTGKYWNLQLTTASWKSCGSMVVVTNGLDSEVSNSTVVGMLAHKTSRTQANTGTCNSLRQAGNPVARWWW